MWITNLLGLLVIATIVWWFWLYKPEEATSAEQGIINVLVENGVYEPARIQIPAHQTSTLRFLRKDTTPCSATVIFNGLDISSDLPVNHPKNIEVTPSKSGNYTFGCQMQMYKGELIVTDE